MSQYSSRIESFDSIRGLAACTVLISHLFLVMQGYGDYDQVYQWKEAADNSPLRIFWYGHAAVVLFFALSGFVLYLLLDKAKLTTPAYIAKRVVRLYVPYIAAVVLGILGAYFIAQTSSLDDFNDWVNQFWTKEITWGSVIEHLLFIGQFNSDRYDFTIWTLVHEMRISLIYPLIYLAVKRWRWWLALLPFAALSVLMVVLRQPIVRDDMDVTDFAFQGGLTAYVYTVHYMLPFAIGAVLARNREAIFAAYARLAGGYRLLIVLATFLLYIYGDTVLEVTKLKTLMPYDWPLMAAAALILLVAAAEPGLRRVLEKTPFLYLGRVSYSLYLFHPIVMLAMLHYFSGEMPLWLLLSLTFVACFILSDIMHRLIEYPAITLSRSAGDHVGRFYDHLCLRFRKNDARDIKANQ